MNGEWKAPATLSRTTFRSPWFEPFGIKPVEVIHSPGNDNLTGRVDVGHEEPAARLAASQGDCFGLVELGAEQRCHSRWFLVGGSSHRSSPFGDDS